MESGVGAAERLERALALAYRYLNRRERTCAEMRQYLLARELGGEAVDAAIAELREQGYLDDARFARLFVQDKRALQDWGSDRITRELRARGVDRELIDAALADDPVDGELDRALSLLDRRFPQMSGSRRDHERALGVLLRKGYDIEVARVALGLRGR